MGNWNHSRDREPDKKEEHAFKEFLISKYERKQWYKSPADVKKEEETVPAPAKPEPKIQPPPSTKVHIIRDGYSSSTEWVCGGVYGENIRATVFP